MISIFYLLSLLFIWNEIYYINNKNKLILKYREMEINLFNIVDVLFYLTRVLYWIWMGIGLFSDMYMWFIAILSIGIFKIPLYYLFRKYYSLYDAISPIITIPILLLMMWHSLSIIIS